MKENEIELTELEISQMKKSTFKGVVDYKIREASRKYLTQLRKQALKIGWFAHI